MPAQSFDDIYLHMSCARLAHDALQYAAQGETGRHPSRHTVDQVLAGLYLVRIARNGYIDVVAQR